MILPPDLSLRHCPRLAGAPSSTPPTSVPAWLRRAVPDGQSLAGQDLEDIMLAAGAAIAALDAVVRRDENWAGAWRQRMLLAWRLLAAQSTGGADRGEHRQGS
tara:strand:+ start:374 stop:682 length:309 start_codon:yes stop_codon:yes gene_type:complete